MDIEETKETETITVIPKESPIPKPERKPEPVEVPEKEREKVPA